MTHKAAHHHQTMVGTDRETREETNKREEAQSDPPGPHLKGKECNEDAKYKAYQPSIRLGAVFHHLITALDTTCF